MKLLDLFCGAGGAGAGYARAGWDVTGVDLHPMPQSPHPVIQADALEYLAEHGHEYDAIHASPPCQHYSRMTGRIHDNQNDHPDLLQPTIELLEGIGLPWVVENVDGAPFPWAFALCGWGFGMPFHRHRYFMLDTWRLMLHPGCPGPTPEGVSINPYRKQNGRTMAELREAMEVPWMTLKQTSQAIPPAYTEHIGRYLMETR